MLRVTVDMLSGRPSPCWEVHDPATVRALLDKIATNPGVIGPVDDDRLGLGFRGIIVEVREESPRRGVPPLFRVPGGPAAEDPAGREVARLLVETIPVGSPSLSGSDVELSSTLRDDLLRILSAY